DMVPETMISTDGPFAVEGDYDDSAYDDWTSADAYDFETSTGTYDGESMSMLLPYDVEAGYPDPFVLPESDWCDCGVYDPMTAPMDWTTDGYASFNDVFALPGADAGYSDAGAYYDQFAPTPGYFDTTSYYDTADGYLDASTPVDTWDMPMTTPGAGFDTGMGYDPTTAFSPMSTYDTTSAYSTSSYDPMSSWDPSAGDAAHDAFIHTITEDYSDPSTGVDLDTMSDTSQYWMDEYNAADDLSWDAWNASVDAYLEGDTMAAYDLNQTSIAADSYADTAWDYSNDAWSSSSYTDTSSSYDADAGY
ncbi:MAG: hypothetical protein KDB02_04935, partial [Acidimicrobiales bacterium]|nr:hypothetical protein [Acidimicrobiales bacterium]